jgi:general secretion pathway protein K
MSCPSNNLRPVQRGAALVVAMLVFALVAALMVGLQRDFTLTLQRGTQHLFSEQAWAYMMGAEYLAQLALREDSLIDARADSPSDHLGELWAQPPTPYPLEAGGWMRGRIEDLQGRFNLNWLPEPTAVGSSNTSAGESGGDGLADNARAPSAVNESPERWTPGQKFLIRLLQTFGEDAMDLEQAMALTEAITDFIDRDAERRQRGAESDEYRYSDFPYLPANRPLASISELRAVQGMTAPVYEALAPLVTVWPDTPSRINILTCPLPVLRSLNGDDQLAPLPEIEGQRLEALRREGEISEVEDLLKDPAFGGQDLAELEPMLGVKSDWFLLDATVELVENERHLFSVLHRRSQGAVAVFRSEGEL